MTRKQRRQMRRENNQAQPAPKALAPVASPLETYIDAFTSQCQPGTDFERILVRRCAEFQVAIDRAQIAEVSFMNECIKILMDETPGLTLEEAIGRVFFEDRFRTKLNLVLRYQAQATRNYRQTRKELEDLIKNRTAKETSESAPSVQPTEKKQVPENGFVWKNAASPEPPAHSAAGPRDQV